MLPLSEMESLIKSLKEQLQKEYVLKPVAVARAPGRLVAYVVYRYYELSLRVSFL